MKTLADLNAIRERMKNQINNRESVAENDTRVVVGMATCGIAAGARTVMNALIEKIEKDKIPAVVTQGGCMGYCYAEPTIEVKVPGKDPVVFGNVDAKVAAEIIDKYILKGELIDGIIPTNYETINEQK